MKKLTVAFAFLIMLTAYSKTATAQYYFYDDSYYDSPFLFELGGSIGAMNCFTDLGGKKGIGKKFLKDLNYGKTHVSGGIFFNVIYQNKIALRVEGTYGEVSADDAVLENVTDIAKARFNRNLNFKSTIREISGLVEIHPLMFLNYENLDRDPPRTSPYIVGGVGYFSFNPQTKIGSRLVDLQPLSTEGQGFKEYPDREVYKLQQISIPVGAGVKYELSPLVNLRGEFLYRILNTDYLDDVSTRYINPQAFVDNGFTGTKLANALAVYDRQINKVTTAGGKRGSPAEKDSYFTFSLKVSIVLGRQSIR